MLALILRAVRSRLAQAFTLVLLAALAAGVAAAGPWYSAAAPQRAAAVAVDAAPAVQRQISMRKAVTISGDPQPVLESFAGSVRAVLPFPAPDPVLGLSQAVNAAGTRLQVGYRDDVCAHLRLAGSCPAAAGEVVISEPTAVRLGLDVGDRLSLQSGSQGTPLRARIVGRYQLLDPAGAYWSNSLFRTEAGLDALLTPMESFSDEQLASPVLTFDAEVPRALLLGSGTESLGDELRAAAVRVSAQQIQLTNSTGPLLDALRRDRAAIRTGVLVALAQVLVLAWFAIGLAGRSTVRDRRGDAALLKLRGSTRRGVLFLTLGQHVLPLLLGVLLGGPAGVLVAAAVAGDVDDAGERRSALLLSGAAALTVLAGALLVLAAVEVVVLRRPVAELLRRVAGRRRDWRADVVDVALLAVAAAAAYQARSNAPDSGLALIAPALVALAVALVAARLLGRLADRAGGVALLAGRLRFGLAAVQLSRQPGTDRVLAVVVVAVAVFGTAVGGWSAGRESARERSVVEAGASRVLTVDVPNRTRLLAAVRAVDPDGRFAMAAVVDPAASPPVLAVDSTRLAAVAGWRPEYGPVGALAEAGRTTAAAPAFTGAGLSLQATNPGADPVAVTVVLRNESTGAETSALLGPVPAGTHTVSADAPGCSTECRLVRWELVQPPDGPGPPRPAVVDATLTVRGLTVRDTSAPVLGAAELGDIRRWRADTGGTAMSVVAGGGALTMAVGPVPGSRDASGNRLYAVDTALPVPLVLAGPVPSTWAAGEATLPALTVPVRVAGSVRALPALGRQGVLIDLETVRRAGGDARLGGTDQVWLTADAPAGVADALTAAGLTVLADESVATRTDRLGQRGPAVAARFGLLSAVVAMLLAAAVVAIVAAADRRAQLEQLRALRQQGLPARTARTAGSTGLAALLAVALVVGLLAAVIARYVTGAAPPVFADGWNVIDPAGPLTGLSLLLAAAGALVILAVTWTLAVLPTIRRLRS